MAYVLLYGLRRIELDSLRNRLERAS